MLSYKDSLPLTSIGIVPFRVKSAETIFAPASTVHGKKQFPPDKMQVDFLSWPIMTAPDETLNGLVG